MSSVGMQMLASLLAVIGWVGVIATCWMPKWKVSAFVGSNIVTAHTIFEGIWMNCVMQSTGQSQCKSYSSLLSLSTDVQAARALTTLSIALGLVGLLLAFFGGKCTSFIQDEVIKARVIVTAGGVLIAAGVLCLIPVSWTASDIIYNYYNPQLADSQRRELGPSLYLGWVSSIMLILGGGLLCRSCPRLEENTHSVKYLIVRSSRATSNTGSQKSETTLPSSSTPIKTYL